MSSPEHLEKGSEYYSYIAKVNSEKDVQQAYLKVKIKHADATHVSCAYRLDNPLGPYHQQAIDDKDYGIGRSLLKILKQKEMCCFAIFLVRYYGHTHLGKRRFKIAEILAEHSVKAWFTKLAKSKARATRRVSHSSIGSAISNQYDSQDEAQENEDEQMEKQEDGDQLQE